MSEQGGQTGEEQYPSIWDNPDINKIAEAAAQIVEDEQRAAELREKLAAQADLEERWRDPRNHHPPLDPGEPRREGHL